MREEVFSYTLFILQQLGVVQSYPTTLPSRMNNLQDLILYIKDQDRIKDQDQVPNSKTYSRKSAHLIFSFWVPCTNPFRWKHERLGNLPYLE